MCRRDVILWAEDDENDAFLMERAFKKAAVSSSFVRVTDGLQATQYLSGQGRYSDRSQYPIPQLLLLDIKMPLMSGFEVLEWKQSRPELEQISVVMLSASGEEQDVKEAYRLGAKGYLVKPANFEDLVGQMEKLNAEWLIPESAQ